MQRLWQPRRSATRHPIHQIVRHAGRKTWRGKDPTLGNPNVSAYDVNRLLLDLDAERVEHVRQYDPDIDGLPEDRYAKRTREDAAAGARIAKFYRTAQKEADSFEATRRDKAVQWHINDLDIISSVLRGAPEQESTTSDLSRQNVNNRLYGLSAEGMRRNGIPQSGKDSPSRFVSYMLHRQKQTQRYHETMLGVTDSMSKKAMFDKMWNSNNMTALKRSLSFIVNTAYGKDLLSGQGQQQLGMLCSEIIGRGKGATALVMLRLCNDLVRNALQKGLPIQRQLWCLGLDLAVRCSAFTAARMYLEAGLKLGEDLHGQNFLSEPLKTILHSIERSRHGTEPVGPSSSPSGHHAAIFGLLTGQDLSGHHSPISIQSMIESLKPSDPEIYHSFIHILGELGALRTLWHFFQRVPQILQNGNGGSGRDESDLREIHEHLANAFLRTARHVQNGQIPIGNLRLAEATNKFEGDCRLDLETIFKSFNSSSGSSAKLSGSPAISISSEMKEIKEAFGMSDITVSMQALEALLVRLGRERTRG